MELALTNYPTIDKIFQLEHELAKLPQLEIPITHTVGAGIYAREGTLPKGSVFTGVIYKVDHMVFIVSGELSVVTHKGVERIKGPCLFVSRAGAKRAGYVHEDVHWVNFIATNETDPDIIMDQSTTNNYDDFIKFYESKELTYD